MFTVPFWKATAERAVKTFAQSFGAFIVLGTTGLLDLDWATAASISGAATLLSVLTSVASSSSGSGPSWGTERLPKKADS
jgi:hypothetical protein